MSNDQFIAVTTNVVSVKDLKDSIVAQIANAVGSVVEGTAEDITGYAADIATSISLAQTLPPEGRDAVIRECQQQVVLLAEKNRIRLSQAGAETVRSVIATASGVLAGVLAAFGQGLGAVAAGAVSKALGGPNPGA